MGATDRGAAPGDGVLRAGRGPAGRRVCARRDLVERHRDVGRTGDRHDQHDHPSAPAPVEVTSTVTEVVAVPFAVRTVDDATVDQGQRLLRTAGRAGSKTVTWLVRTRDGVEVGRTVSGEQVTAAPVDEVTAVGTKVPAPAPKPTTTTPKPAPEPTQPAPPPAGCRVCDPNYSGGCVPIASDVDCAGGKGNGPAYVQGPVQVVGRDIYGLDADHDGVGCED